MLAKVFARTVKASFHRGDAGVENLGDFRMTPALLDQRQQGPILRAKLRQRMPQGVQLLGVHRAGRLGNVFVLLPERKENPPELLPPQLIDARVSRQPEQPGFELRRRLETIQRADHHDEDLLRQILHVIAAVRHGINEAGNPMLIPDDEFPLGPLVALLCPADKIRQGIGCS